uniref:Putative secreted protein n=1 Tax=Anopheles triannulatus TaxID=58253 RepID=A0A2M4B4D5_9DIPT
MFVGLVYVCLCSTSVDVLSDLVVRHREEEVTTQPLYVPGYQNEIATATVSRPRLELGEAKKWLPFSVVVWLGFELLWGVGLLIHTSPPQSTTTTPHQLSHDRREITSSAVPLTIRWWSNRWCGRIVGEDVCGSNYRHNYTCPDRSGVSSRRLSSWPQLLCHRALNLCLVFRSFSESYLSILWTPLSAALSVPSARAKNGYRGIRNETCHLNLPLSFCRFRRNMAIGGIPSV